MVTARFFAQRLGESFGGTSSGAARLQWQALPGRRRASASCRMELVGLEAGAWTGLPHAPFEAVPKRVTTSKYDTPPEKISQFPTEMAPSINPPGSLKTDRFRVLFSLGAPVLCCLGLARCLCFVVVHLLVSCFCSFVWLATTDQPEKGSPLR